MPVEKKEPLHPRLNNKANRARHDREKQQIRMIKIAAFAVLGAIALSLISGLVYTGLIKPNKVLAQVNSEKVTVSDFEKAVRYQRNNLISNYEYMQQLYSSFGIQMDEATRSQYEMQLLPEYANLIGAEVYTNLVDQIILDYGAKADGYEVSDAEVDTRMQELFGYYANGTPTAEPTDLPFEDTPTPSEEQIKLLNYTATPEPTEIPEENDLEGLGDEGPTTDTDFALDVAATAVSEITDETEAEADVTVEPELTEAIEETADESLASEDPAEATNAEIESEATTETTADAAIDEAAADEAAVEETAMDETAGDEAAAEETIPTEGPTATPEPTATVYTEELYQQNVDTYFSSNEYTDRAFERKQVYYELLRNKVRADLEKTIEREQDMVWARHILVATEEEANAVIERLNNGEDWNLIAAEVSTDSGNKDNGGDLGWFGEGQMVAPFEEAAYAQEVGTYSSAPVQTDFGWHVIQIIAHEMHPITASESTQAVNIAYTNWLDAHRETLNIKTSDDWRNYVPTDPQLSYSTVQY